MLFLSYALEDQEEKGAQKPTNREGSKESIVSYVALLLTGTLFDSAINHSSTSYLYLEVMTSQGLIQLAILSHVARSVSVSTFPKLTVL